MRILGGDGGIYIYHDGNISLTRNVNILESLKVYGTAFAFTLTADNANIAETLTAKTLSAGTANISGNTFFNGNVGVGTTTPQGGFRFIR